MRKRRPRKPLIEEGEGPDIWQRLSRWLLVLVFLLVMAGILSLFWPEIERQELLDADLQELTALRDDIVEERNKLAARLEWMRTDPEYLETIARDRLDLYKEGEHILRLEDLRSSSIEAPATAPEAERPVLKATVLEE